MGSFDFADGSLRDPSASLRMTETGHLQSPCLLRGFGLCFRAFSIFQSSPWRCGGLPFPRRCSGGLRIRKIRPDTGCAAGGRARIRPEFRSRRRGAGRPCCVSRSRMFTAPSSTRTDSSANSGSGGETSNSSSISPTICSRMSSTVITPAVEPNSSTTTARCRRRSLNSSSSSVRTLVSGTTRTSCMIWPICMRAMREAERLAGIDSAGDASSASVLCNRARRRCARGRAAGRTPGRASAGLRPRG